MSKIQAAFNALGRELLDSEKPAVAAFRKKYANIGSSGIAESTLVEKTPMRDVFYYSMTTPVAKNPMGHLFCYLLNVENAEWIAHQPSILEWTQQGCVSLVGRTTVVIKGVSSTQSMCKFTRDRHCDQVLGFAYPKKNKV